MQLTQLNSFLAFFTGSLKALVDMSYKQACFFHNSINFSSNSSLQNSIFRQTRQNTSYMTSWPTNWVNWVTTFRTDRWQFFTLWTCRQLDVQLSWVELCCYKRALTKINYFFSETFLISRIPLTGWYAAILFCVYAVFVYFCAFVFSFYIVSQKMSQVWLAIALTYIHRFL